MFKNLKEAYKVWRGYDQGSWADLPWMYNYELQTDYQNECGDRNPSSMKIWILRHWRMLFFAINKDKWCYERKWYAWMQVHTRFIRFAWGEAKMRIQMWMCDKYGHKIVDDSSAGPDSGDMDCYCKRCGMSWHHQLY